jgi:hypothetical protein
MLAARTEWLDGNVEQLKILPKERVVDEKRMHVAD